MTLAVTRAHIARRDHDRELKMEQSVLSLLIKTSNGNAIQNPLVGTANKAASVPPVVSGTPNWSLLANAAA
jgi:hypothetical protein